MVSPLDLWLWNFNNHTIFKIAILSKEKILVQSAAQKWSSWSSQHEMGNFHFSLEKVPKGGPLEDLVTFSCWIKPLFSPSFSLVSHWFSSEYDYFTSWNKSICIPGNIKSPFKYYVSRINVQLAMFLQNLPKKIFVKQFNAINVHSWKL